MALRSSNSGPVTRERLSLELDGILIQQVPHSPARTAIATRSGLQRPRTALHPVHHHIKTLLGLQGDRPGWDLPLLPPSRTMVCFQIRPRMSATSRRKDEASILCQPQRAGQLHQARKDRRGNLWQGVQGQGPHHQQAGCSQEDATRGGVPANGTYHASCSKEPLPKSPSGLPAPARAIPSSPQMEEEGVPSTALREISLLLMLSKSNHIVR